MKLKSFFIMLIITLSFCGYSQKQATISSKFEPFKRVNPIKIDGILNDLDWQKAKFSDKLYDKDDNSKIYTNTKTYFTYDANNIYVAFQCKTNDVNALPKTKLEKDDQTILGNERVAFCLDSYNDGIMAYVFMVDAAGNQIDLGLNSGKDLNNSFSSNWTSACKRESDGYTIEMKIPLDKLPIHWNKGKVEMAIQMIRIDKQNNKELNYPFLYPKKPNNLKQFQKVILREINKTHPTNLSGCDLKERLAFKKSKIDTNTLLGRCKGGDASIMDFAIFKERTIQGAINPREFNYDLQTKSINDYFKNTKYIQEHFSANEDFEKFLVRTQTTAFLVIQNDSILYEKYYNGFTKNAVFTSFSVAKSFVSTLIGIAISEGYIKSEEEKITTYIPELLKKDVRFSDITIKDLISMSSGLVYSEEGFPSDADITYQSPDLRNAVLESIKIEEAPGKHWHYNNYNLLLEGLILERTTKMTVAKFMEEKLWKKMGGGNASWSLDENGFEKMESGINCSALDYARFAALMLNDGKYNNLQIIPKNWVQKTTQPKNTSEDYYDLPKYNIFYSDHWWGKYRSGQENKNDFFAMGNKGEYVYVCPQKKLILIRLGFEYGLPTPSTFSWPEMFYQFASEFNINSKTTKK